MDWFSVNQLSSALVESFTQLNLCGYQDCSEIEIKTINHWLGILSSLIEHDVADFDANSNNIIDKIEKLLLPYEKIDNVQLLEGDFVICLEFSVEILMWFFQKNAFISPEGLRTIVLMVVNFHLGKNRIPRFSCETFLNVIHFFSGRPKWRNICMPRN